MPLLLAIDQSTSGTKALLYDDTGRLLDKESREHHQIYPQPGWVEHDAEEIWRNTCEVVGQVIARHSPRVAEIACLSITNQRETIRCATPSSGNAVAGTPSVVNSPLPVTKIASGNSPACALILIFPRRN
jgi:glycerol kinase